MKDLFFLSLVCFLLIGCDRTIYYHFQIENASNYKVSVAYAASQTDTLIEILPNQNHTIYKEARLGPPTDFIGEEMYLFSHINILTVDSVKANKNFYERRFWKFLSTDTTGTYLLQLQENDF